MKRPAFITAFLLLLAYNGFSQACTGIINTFPYQEGFESSNGNWVTGGTASDWTWGSPSKTTITSAAVGNKCWITGGLNNTTYNAGENSWLMSPCFDFSSLQFPELNFLFFCETERRFDGASFQYSIDGGNNWRTLGTDNSNTGNCAITNWYNAGSVTYLGNSAGWSGSIKPDNGSCLGGSGSGTWLSARHPLRELAGQPNVRLRFRFGAGTQCNSFDGFAVDDINIWEATPPVLELTSGCGLDGRVGFTAISLCIVKYEWDFGDPASGADNTSTLANPVHQYGTLGRDYTATLTAEYGNGVKVTAKKNVRLLDASKTISWPGACSNIANATITVNPVGSPDNFYFYYWDISPPQSTQTVTNCGPGTYKVIVSAADACGITLNFELKAPSAIIPETIITNAACDKDNGAIAVKLDGAFPPYTFNWSNGAATPVIDNLPPGDYTVNITDANNCSFTAGPYKVVNEAPPVKPFLGRDRNICPGQVINLSPGSFASYRWQDGTTMPVFTARSAGTFWVEVTDQRGCMLRDTVQISGECREIYFPAAFTPNNDGNNDFFGPLGNVSEVEDYSLGIFDRYGNRAFFSIDPLEKWDGNFKGSDPNSGVFVWVCKFRLNGASQLRKGTITLLR